MQRNKLRIKKKRLERYMMLKGQKLIKITSCTWNRIDMLGKSRYKLGPGLLVVKVTRYNLGHRFEIRRMRIIICKLILNDVDRCGEE